MQAENASEYLGQFTYFRGWKHKRRVFLVKGDDAYVDRIYKEAVGPMRCDMAIRNVNLGEKKGERLSNFLKN